MGEIMHNSSESDLNSDREDTAKKQLSHQVKKKSLRRVLDFPKIAFLKIRDFIRYRILFFSKTELLEETERKELLFYVLFFVDIILIDPIFAILPEIIAIFKKETTDPYTIGIDTTKFIFSIIEPLTFIILTIFFLIFKNLKYTFSITLFIASLLFNLCLIQWIVFSNAKDFVNPLFFFFIFTPLINIHLSHRSFHAVFFWCLIFIGLISSIFIYHFINNFELSQLDNPVTRRVRIFMFGGVLLMLCTFNFYCFIANKFLIQKERKMFETTAMLISTLDFENVFINKIMNTEKTTQIQRYLKEIILQLKNYKAFLPTFKRNRTVSEYEQSSNGSVVSQSSTNTENTNSSVSIKDEKNEKNDLFCQEKNVILLMLCVNIKKKHQKNIIEGSGERNKFIVRTFNDILSIISPIIEREGGFISNIFNNNIFISFGCFSKRLLIRESLSKAVKSCFLIKKKWKHKRNLDDSVVLDCYIKHNCLIQFGHFGNQSFRRFNLFGENVTLLEEMKQITKRIINEERNDGIIVVEGDEIYRQLKYDFKLKQIGINRKNQDIFEIIKWNNAGTKKEDEWIYKLGESHFIESKTENQEEKIQQIWSFIKLENLKEAKIQFDNLMMQKTEEKNEFQVKYIMYLKNYLTKFE